jgi:hypothetical protein
LDGFFVAGNKAVNSTQIVRLPLSGTIFLIGDLFYLIQVEYSSIRSASFHPSKRLTLQMFQNGLPRGLPSESLFAPEHLYGSPRIVTVEPSGQLCASISSQTLSSGTILTAGIYSILSLQARDTFGNPLSVQSIANNNISALFDGQILEKPLFEYSSSSGNISMQFVLKKKCTFNVQWLVGRIAIGNKISISVIPNNPDFLSISFLDDVRPYFTAGIQFHRALVILDSFGNRRSFLEKSQDFSQNIAFLLNVSRDHFFHNTTICRSYAEYALIPLKYRINHSLYFSQVRHV